MHQAWTRLGECNHCGHCCQSVGAMEHVVGPGQAPDPAFLDAHGYTLGSDGTRRKWLTLTDPCPQHEGERCRIYDTRPETCRSFPEKPDNLELTPCSYWFESTIVPGSIVRWGGQGSPYPHRLRAYADTRSAVVAS